MMERVNTYFEKLEGLSIEELDRSVEKLVRAEKRNVALVIAHIAELSRRKGHLERGYKSLWDYCTRRLNLSEGSVARRIQVAKTCKRFPQILVALADNQISLTVAGILAPVLTEGNVEKLLADCPGMSSREVEEYVVALRPKPVFTPSIRKAPSPSPAPAMLTLPPPERTSPRPACRVSPTILEPARPETFNFRFAADRRFKEKFERVAEVLGVENPAQHMAEILEQALDVLLDKKDVRRKRARRLKRESQAGKRKTRAREVLAQSRYLSSQVRERVHERAGYECQYVAPDGARCRSRTGLQIEHEKPFALYRSHDEKHLRLFCGPHNRLAAEKVFGTSLSKRKSMPLGRGRLSVKRRWIHVHRHHFRQLRVFHQRPKPSADFPVLGAIHFD